jgi:hypothetical protein
MQNFGRGMWRRLNDYDVINQINRQNIQAQEYLAYKEYQMKLNRQKQINAYREKIIQEKRRERELEQLNKQNFEQIYEQKEELRNDWDSNSVYFEITTVENEMPVELTLEEPIEEEQIFEEILDDKIKVIEIEEEPKKDNKLIPKKLKKKNKKMLN